MNEKWIENIREKMSEFETTPPEGLWDSMQRKLYARKKRKRRILSAAAAASAALIIGLYNAFTPGTTTIPQPPVLCLATIDHDDKANVILEKEAPAQNNPLSHQFSTGNKSKHSKIPILKDTSGVLESTLTGEPANKDIPATDTIMIMAPETKLLESTLSDESGEEAYESYASIDQDWSIEKSHFTISVSASADGMGGLFSNDNDFFKSQSDKMYAENSIGSRFGGGIFCDSNSSGSAVAPAPSPMEIFDHKLPLRFSLNLSFPLYRNLTMDTGVTYSYLKSDIKYKSYYSEIQYAQQELHFIGIPISLRYTALKLPHCDLYISGGAMAEKCIGGSINCDDRSDTPYSYPGCDERPFQFSLNAALGVQYNIVKDCGLYLEPGAGIYLDNGSRLRTIYSERPLTFNLNIGLRFSPARR